VLSLVTGRLALLELPTKVPAEIERGDVGAWKATALLALEHHPDVIERRLADQSSPGRRPRGCQGGRFGPGEGQAEYAREQLACEEITRHDMCLPSP
jgi:hypothetical protein